MFLALVEFCGMLTVGSWQLAIDGKLLVLVFSSCYIYTVLILNWFLSRYVRLFQFTEWMMPVALDC